MSQENVEIVRRFIVLPIEDGLTYADPDIVYNPVEETPVQGRDAVRASVERWEDEWAEYRATPEDFVATDDRVVVSVHYRGRGPGSGIEVDAVFHEVYTFRDGKIVRYDEFTERSEALEAAGLSE